MRYLEEIELQKAVALWDLCRAWQVLPRAGGLDEQPAREVEILRVCDRAAEEYRRWRRAPRELTGDETVTHLRQMIRVMGGKKAR